MQNSMIYIYCLGNFRPEPDCFPESVTLKTLKIGEFYVIAKQVSEMDFSDENLRRHLSDKQWMKTNVQDHTAVINLIMENHEVIPFKFGTVFYEETSLRTFITSQSTTLNRSLLTLGGREEWGIQVFCNRKTIRRHIDELSEPAAALEREIMASSPGKAHLLIGKKTILIENEIDRICKNFGQEYLVGFNHQSDSFFLNNLLPKEFTEREDTMILNANFLVHKNKVNTFKEIFEKGRKKGATVGFFLEISGPWPPITFI